jgi:hypothetical protein
LVRGRSSRALGLAALLVVILTGVTLATPVPVVAIGDGSKELFARLDDGEALTYSYRQSIYDVPVYQDFMRAGERIDLLRVRSPDIRSVEYFRWDGNIVQDAQGQWTEDAPPSQHAELVIRLTPLGQQRMTTPRWTVDLLAEFGETIVTLRVDRRPRGLVLLRGAR